MRQWIFALGLVCFGVLKIGATNLPFGSAPATYGISLASESTAYVAGSWTEDHSTTGQNIVCVVDYAIIDNICGDPGPTYASHIPIPAVPGGITPPGTDYLWDDGDPAYGAPISTTLTGLTANDYYQVSFYQASSQETGAPSKAYDDSWQVYLIPGVTSGVYMCPFTYCSSVVNPDPGDLAFTSQVMDNTGQETTNWQLQTFIFKASAATEVLEFVTHAVGSGNFTPPLLALADVTVNPSVPEPGTCALTLLGVGLVFGISRMRRRSSSRE